ncbi:MAG: hypothetical protein RLZZ301_789 [Bacteroidota bacterium]|jgi:DNA uptake protein ComE-like DNA-binding protein
MNTPQPIISRRISRGMWLLILCCIGIIFSPRILLTWFASPGLYIEYEEATAETKKRIPTVGMTKPQKSCLARAQLASALTLTQWISLGLSPKQAASLLRYRDKFGFHSLKQMQCIRVLPRLILDQIQDSLLFEPTALHKEGYAPLKFSIPEQKKQVLLDINTCTFEELDALPGLGTYSAQKIVNYRSYLGGYVSLAQLYEIHGIDSSLITRLSPTLKLGSFPLKTLSINTATIEQLQAHPYLSWKQANSIVKMRIQKGGFRQLDEIKESLLIDAETYEKVHAYLSL